MTVLITLSAHNGRLTEKAAVTQENPDAKVEESSVIFRCRIFTEDAS